MQSCVKTRLKDSATIRASSRHANPVDFSRGASKTGVKKLQAAAKDEKPCPKKASRCGKKTKKEKEHKGGLGPSSKGSNHDIPSTTTAPPPPPPSSHRSAELRASKRDCLDRTTGGGALPGIDPYNCSISSGPVLQEGGSGGGRGKTSAKDLTPMMRRKQSEAITGGGGGSPSAAPPPSTDPLCHREPPPPRHAATRLPCLTTKPTEPRGGGGGASLARTINSLATSRREARREGSSSDLANPSIVGGSLSGSVGGGGSSSRPTSRGVLEPLPLPQQPHHHHLFPVGGELSVGSSGPAIGGGKPPPVVNREEGPSEKSSRSVSHGSLVKTHSTDDEYDEDDYEDEEDEGDEEEGDEENESDDSTDEEDSDEETNVSEEDEVSAGDPSDNESVVSSKRKGHSSRKRASGGRYRARQRKICLTVKVSREGDRNVKLFTIYKDTSFLHFAEEVMWRFRYEELPDFDMYCIDAAGDHVDIDRRQDFEGLTAPYWARLNQMHLENQRNHAVENSNASEHSRPLNHTTHIRHPTGQGGGGGNREDSADDGRSTETVIRLYVRDSCSYRRTYPQPQESIGGVGAFTHSSRFSTDRMNMTSNFAISAVEARLASTKEMPKPMETRRRSVSGPAAPHLRDRLHSREHAELGDLSHLHKAVSDAHAGLNDTLTCSPSSQKRRSLMEVLKRANAASLSNSFSGCVNNQLQWTRMAVLGKGSFGTVYEGITTDGKLMAVKVQELPMNDNADEIRAVQSEINLMCTMTHKNIVAYYGCQVNNLGNGSRQMEIFLELCHGGTLAQMRQRFERAKKPFSISLVRSYTRQILQGLCYLHSCNVMHRDIKCDNVLISATGEAKLSDFGCSKRIGAATIAVRSDFAKEGRGEGRGRNSGNFPSSASAAAHHSIVGSPLFMAPEVLQASGADGGVGGGSGGYSMAADIWSVGCVVLELLGREPWIVSGRNIFQLMFHISQSKGLPNGVPARCPAVLLDFFHMCFERNPTRRWTAAQLLKHPWMVCPESELEEVPADEAAGK